jgi:hypothetical protein
MAAVASGPNTTASETARPRQRQPLATRVLERRTTKQRAFLTALENLGTIQAACLASRVGRRTVYDWIDREPRFAAAFNLARESAADLVEAEVRRRGMVGVPEPVFFQGAVVGHVQRYSDACLLAVLSAYRPERFGRHRAAKPSDPTGDAVVHVSYDHNLKPTEAK